MQTANYFLSEFWRHINNIKAMRGTSGKVHISALIVEVFLASILLPAAIAAIVATNTDDWDATAAEFWTTYLPILVVVGVVIGIVYPILPRGKGA